MIRPENTHPGDNDVELRDSDNLETTLAAPLPATTDSPSSEADAGLLEEPDGLDLPFDSDEDEEPPSQEITMTDLGASRDPGSLHSPELDDYDAPGAIDIEELDEDALADTDIPPDALLDPLEP